MPGGGLHRPAFACTCFTADELKNFIAYRHLRLQTHNEAEGPSALANCARDVSKIGRERVDNRSRLYGWFLGTVE